MAIKNGFVVLLDSEYKAQGSLQSLFGSNESA